MVIHRRVCTTGEEAGRGRRSLQREKRRRAFRFLFFSAFFPLLRVASPPAIFRGDFSLGAISHLRRAPADVAAWAVMDSNSIPQRSGTKPSLIVRTVFISFTPSLRAKNVFHVDVPARRNPS